jgi:hypothetical protein
MKCGMKLLSQCSLQNSIREQFKYVVNGLALSTDFSAANYYHDN